MELFLAIICLASFIAFDYFANLVWNQKFEHAKFISVILFIDGIHALGNSMVYFSNFLQ